MKRIRHVKFTVFSLSGIIICLLIQGYSHLSPSHDNPVQEDIHVSRSYDDSEINYFQPLKPTHFPFPEALRPHVEFWKKIFTEHTSTQAVIHDRRHVGIIYTVIDLTEKQRYSASARRKAIRPVIQKYKSMLLTLNKLDPEKIDTLNKEEKRVFRMIQEVPGNYTFSRARRNFRVQYGLKDRFQKAMVNSTRYIKDMEQIFIRHGLPVELSRLPFVESSFNIEAHSRAGAAGIWQFTRSTGKHYMRIDPVIDERRDPLKSTEAAAKLLSSYYNELKSWPLAITAYNHGAAAMHRAINKTKSRDIERIINNYKSRTFGFSSRNFYSEFLAVLEILRDYRPYFGEPEFLTPDEYEVFILEDYIKMNTLLAHTSLDGKVITRLNPELRQSVLTSRRFLPKQYHLKIPSGMKEQLTKEYAMIASTEKRRHLNITKLHRVRYGQSLSYIAKLYNTSVQAIISVNSIKDPDKLMKGQLLKIPVQA
ncbi:MAG: hypothetical protein AMK71_01105 [Nitrospira bacterium SG8_35_4]|nr:MAG: hypothetical protein AMK71_01105 [Nitrospira bacterium SG8_35_4]